MVVGQLAVSFRTSFQSHMFIIVLQISRLKESMFKRKIKTDLAARPLSTPLDAAPSSSHLPTTNKI